MTTSLLRQFRLALAGLAVLVSAALAASCGDGGSSSTASAFEIPCAGPEDCDHESYCRSDDENCGPGKCADRPVHHGAYDVFVSCGCDGKLYNSVAKARANGFDVGKNQRCTQVPGVAWYCGDRILCGLAPCKTPGELCNPDPCLSQPVPGDVCAHSEFGYECMLFGFDIDSCEDPHVLDICNSCVTLPCGSDNTHRFSSFTCSSDACGGLSIECMK